MRKYVEIYYDKNNKTQRFIICGAEDCTATIQRRLQEMNIPFTSSKFLGKYEPLTDYKCQTFRYAQKYQWLTTIDLTITEA